MILNENELRKAANSARREYKYNYYASMQFDRNKSYDLFISHSFKDKEIVVGLYYLFDSAGYKVYIDWLEDKSLNRDNVDAQTAAVIKQRIKQSKGLSYIATANIISSKWCPWELGISDGMHGKACVLPVMSGPFSGQEYLALYPYLEYRSNLGISGADFYVCAQGNRESCATLRSWLNGRTL